MEEYPEADLKVYVIWVKMLPGDRREAWDPDLLPDPRVSHFWDGKWVAGRWFAKHVLGSEGIAWDIYFLYSPKATWEISPPPLTSSGSTVIAESDRLLHDIRSLIEQ